MLEIRKLTADAAAPIWTTATNNTLDMAAGPYLRQAQANTASGTAYMPHSAWPPLFRMETPKAVKSAQLHPNGSTDLNSRCLEQRPSSSPQAAVACSLPVLGWQDSPVATQQPGW
jgi:hypothetical protein